MLAGDAKLLESQRAGLEEPLDVAAHSLLQLRGVRLTGIDISLPIKPGIDSDTETDLMIRYL
jgi:hypothetical protein